jgi:MFS family permease
VKAGGLERLGPLRERPFRLLWLGRTASAIGDSLIPVALAFAVLSIGGGVSGLGIVLASFTISRASVMLLGGVWADRLPRRAVMIAADLIRFGTEAATAALLLGGVARVWQIAVLQAAAGAAGSFFTPASSALLPHAVSSRRLQKANSLLSLSDSATNIFGPAISGVIVAAAGPGWCFAIDAGSFLVSAAFVSAMRIASGTRPATQRFLHDLADGWREVRLHRWLTAGFLGVALFNLGVGVYFVLGPVVSRDHLGGAQAWGLILAAGAVGGVLGGLVAYPIRPRHPVAAAFAIWSLGCLPAFFLIRPFPVAAIMAASAVLSGSILVGNALWETAMQQEVRPDRLARVVSIDWVLSLCLMPAGQALAGPLEAALGTRATLALAGTLMCVPNLLVLAFVREVRRLTRPDKASPALSTTSQP